MNRSFIATLTLGLLVHVTGNVAAAELQDGLMCNQMGREIALRAAEQIDPGIDAATRTRLAAIAREVCVEFNTGVPAGAQFGESAPAEAEEQPGKSGFLNPQVIDPADRVRRPGLKRL